MNKIKHAKMTRSENMRRIKSKDTQPELLVRRLIFSLGYRYRLHDKSLPGTPDIVFKSRKKLIFVHGCFWHGHGCKASLEPKTNASFWVDKIRRNQLRDQVQLSALKDAHWDILQIWQCETRDIVALSERLSIFIGPRRMQKIE